MIAIHLEHGSAVVAALCLMAGGLGVTSAIHDAGVPSAIVAAIGPQEAQQWLDVIFAGLNKLFAAINLGIGLWQGAAVIHRHRHRRKQASRGKGGRGGYDVTPHTGGVSSDTPSIRSEGDRSDYRL